MESSNFKIPKVDGQCTNETTTARRSLSAKPLAKHSLSQSVGTALILKHHKCSYTTTYNKPPGKTSAEVNSHGLESQLCAAKAKSRSISLVTDSPSSSDPIPSKHRATPQEQHLQPDMNSGDEKGHIMTYMWNISLNLLYSFVGSTGVLVGSVTNQISAIHLTKDKQAASMSPSSSSSSSPSEECVVDGTQLIE